METTAACADQSTIKLPEQHWACCAVPGRYKAQMTPDVDWTAVGDTHVAQVQAVVLM